MNQLVSLPIEAIRYRPDARRRGDEALAQLADSIHQIGLINPIRVRQISDGVYEVVAGAHRLQACDSLDWHEVPCFVVDENDLHARLAMIDENLMRAELTASERASQTADRKAIFERLHPDTRHGAIGNGRSPERNADAESRQAGDSTSSNEKKVVDRFTVDTAAASGRSERAVQRDAERGEKVIPEVMGMITGTRLDTGTYLDKIKKLPPNEQVQAVKRDLTQPSPAPERGGIAKRFAKTDAADSPSARPFERFIGLVNDIEAIEISDLMTDVDRRRRAELGQRASGLADRMGEVMERLDR